ncbi:MAG: EAL domain-containing protein [Gammaproteobacteria bacterium]|jgi:EAL domain-containing protein (putative c-di-GMP-specific phosphodiesterase class I)/GGDEF domain-containing protein|nr:EAL domain-containing protein [Gammaproteobacteria bacterium]
MKIFRTLFIVQIVCTLILQTVLIYALITATQQQQKQLIMTQQQVISQALKSFEGEDYAAFAQSLRSSINIQQLHLSNTDGTVLTEFNSTTQNSSLVADLFKIAGFPRELASVKYAEQSLQLRFKPNLDNQDQAFMQALWVVLLAPLFLVLVPALVAPVQAKTIMVKLNRSLSSAMDRFMRDPAANLPDLNLPDEFDDVVMTLQRFGDFSQQQFSEMSRAAKLVAEDAYKDTVTNLPNRNRFVQYYEEHLRDSNNVDFGIFAIVRCTELQTINQSRGYQEGDKYIREVAAISERAAATYRDALVYRLNSSDFGVLIPRITAKEAENFGMLLQSKFNEYQKLTELDSVAYTGMVSYQAGRALGELLAIADTAISLAQTKQTNFWHLQKDDSQADGATMGYGNQNWRNVIDDVLGHERISLLTQSIQPANRSSKTYSEILVRFSTAEGQLLPTASFLAMAEKLDKIIAVDRLIIETALNTIKSKNLQDQYFGLNLSPRCVHDDQFIIWLERRLLKDASIANKLVFEISEFGLQQNLKTSKRFIDMIHRAGARITVEKFGTGITSFKFFRDLKPDFVKMDGSYTRHIDDDKNNQYFMRLMIDLAHRIGVNVFAESVETQEEKHMLESLFIDGTQGYYIGKPAPI